MKKIILSIAFALAAVSASGAQLLEGIVVRVGDRIVTRTQYEGRLREVNADIEKNAPPEKVAELKKEARASLTNQLVAELLLKDRADRLSITVTDEDIKDAVNRLKQQYNITTDEQFAQSLAASGLNRADMEARLRETLITNKVFARELRNRQDLSDTELRERYNREKESYRLPERAQLREIVVMKPEAPGSLDDASQRAKDVAEAARKTGADFANLASTLSESASREKGGDLGEVAKGDLVGELNTPVFASPAGTILGPIETKSAWHIVKIEKRLPSEVPGFDLVKEKLRREANDETFQRDYKAYIESLRKDAFIQINEDLIPKA